MKLRIGLLAASALLVTPAWAQQIAAAETTEHVVVLGTLPGSDIGLSPDRVPGALQSFDASQMTAQHGGSVLSALGSQTAGVSLTVQQPINNISRVAIQALAAVLGGAQSLHCDGYDEALALPTERAALIALRTQQIIAHETGAANTVDPLGGSYFIEKLTSELEEEAWDYFRKIDAMGGMIEAVEAGFPQKEIHESAYLYQRAVERGEKVIVGVNAYQMNSGELGEPNILQIDESVARLQEERLAKLRAKRDNTAAERALDELRRGAENPDANTMPLLIDCARADCTLGEMCDALRPVFGEYQEPDF